MTTSKIIVESAVALLVVNAGVLWSVLLAGFLLRLALRAERNRRTTGPKPAATQSSPSWVLSRTEG